MITITVNGLDPAVEGASQLEAMAHQMEKALQLAEAKSAGYGDAWRQQGWMGNLARIFSKTSRLKNLLWQTSAKEVHDEAVEDTALDMINLCVFFLLNRGADNRWGK